jgi:hypothetical protein
MFFHNWPINVQLEALLSYQANIIDTNEEEKTLDPGLRRGDGQ